MITARENPFTAERIHALAFHPQGVSREALLEKWEQLGRRAAIVGPHGTGKSTCLKALAKDFEDQGYSVSVLNLNDEKTKLSQGEMEAVRSAGAGTIIMLDGAERLGVLGWYRFNRYSQSAGGLLITSHQNSRLPTLLETQTSPELLKRLLAELGVTVLSDDLTGQLFERYGGNIRDIFHHLYLHPPAVLK